jgi:hypothetical protein
MSSVFFLQGWAAMLYAPFDLLRHDMNRQTCAGISVSRPSPIPVESQDMANKASQHIPYTF